MNASSSSNPLPPSPHPAAPLPPPRLKEVFPTAWLRKCGIMVKLGGVAFLGLLLLIPLAMVDDLLAERLGRCHQAVADITGSWGKHQTVIGPILTVPYEYETLEDHPQVVAGFRTQEKVKVTRSAKAYFLPESLEINGTLEPHFLHRGIYDALVYRTDLQVRGKFAPPDFGALGVEPTAVHWERATVTMLVSDLRGVREGLSIELGGRSYAFTPGAEIIPQGSGLHAVITGGEAMTAGGGAFDLRIALNGSGPLKFAPLGMHTRAALTSPWPDPGFQGAFLPTEREINEKGFAASWAVSYYGRSYPQSWDSRTCPAFPAQAIDASLFGVELVRLVDSYRTVERAIKYGILFIVLVFGTCFLFEMLGGERVHPIQYALVGAALVLFYLGLLSLSEFVNFGTAYGIAAGAATAMVASYAGAILVRRRHALGLAAGLAGVYGFLYVILQMQDYALVWGTAGLFIVLGIAMYATRDLRKLEEGEPAPAPASS